MSAEQVVFTVAGAICISGSVTAVTLRDPRGAGGALLATLLALGVLYALLSAPVVAGAVVLIALLGIVPAAVHLTATAPRAHPWADLRSVAGQATVICVPLLVVLLLTVASGELPLNVSLRSTDGYDIGGLGDLLAGRSALSAVAAGVLLVVAVAAARAATRGRAR